MDGFFPINYGLRLFPQIAFPWIVRPDTSNLGPNILHFHLYSVHFYALRQTAHCVLQKSVANPIQIRCIYTIDHQRCLYIFFRFEGFHRAHKKGARRFCNWIYAETPHAVCSLYAPHHFAMNSTPSVPGPQWLEITPPALVSRISQNMLSPFR